MREGRRLGGPLVDLFAAETPPGAAGPRLAVIVPRYGRPAVARNRVRRRLREIARREWLPAARVAGVRLDLVMRARPAAYGRSYRQLHDAVRERLAALDPRCPGR